jgi:hypothetical protein
MRNDDHSFKFEVVKFKHDDSLRPLKRQPRRLESKVISAISVVVSEESGEEAKK